MLEQVRNIGIFGTFDVENYGDLLFPLIAQEELGKRLGNVRVQPFSYHSKSLPDWPFEVTSLTRLPELAETLAAVLIGGGFLIRFDKDIAENYFPPVSTIHHPTGYWLTPALIAREHGVPLIWNAPGMHDNVIPQWAVPLMQLSLQHSSYIAVRDHATGQQLSAWTNGTPVSVMPDTGFGISALIASRGMSREFEKLKLSAGLGEDFIVVQGTARARPYLEFLRKHSPRFDRFRFLVLPIGPALGDDKNVIDDLLPNATHLPFWPDPLLLAEVISHAAAVVGQSFHLAVTALAFGVPCFSIADLSRGKFTALERFNSLYALKLDTDPDWFSERLGKTRVSQEIEDVFVQLQNHWDLVADIIRAGATKSPAKINGFWQSVAGLLEASADASDNLSVAISEIQTRDEKLNELLQSPSWRATAPARFLMRKLKGLTNPPNR